MKKWMSRFMAVFGMVGLIGSFWVYSLSYPMMDSSILLLTIPFVLLIIIALTRWNSWKK